MKRDSWSQLWSMARFRMFFVNTSFPKVNYLLSIPMKFFVLEYCALACLSELTSLGLSVNIPDKHGAFPIHYAARLEAEENMKKKYDLLKKLIEIGAQLNVMDGEGLQAIHWAVCMGKFLNF